MADESGNEPAGASMPGARPIGEGSAANVYVTQGVPHQSNGFGIAGFVLSLVGLILETICCFVFAPISLVVGLLCIVGLIVSIVGLRKEPRGMAIAGLILGIIGLLVYVVAILAVVFGVAVFAAAAAEQDRLRNSSPGPAYTLPATPTMRLHLTVEDLRETNFAPVPSKLLWR